MKDFKDFKNKKTILLIILILALIGGVIFGLYYDFGITKKQKISKLSYNYEKYPDFEENILKIDDFLKKHYTKNKPQTKLLEEIEKNEEVKIDDWVNFLNQLFETFSWPLCDSTKTDIEIQKYLENNSFLTAINILNKESKEEFDLQKIKEIYNNLKPNKDLNSNDFNCFNSKKEILKNIFQTSFEIKNKLLPFSTIVLSPVENNNDLKKIYDLLIKNQNLNNYQSNLNNFYRNWNENIKQQLNIPNLGNLPNKNHVLRNPQTFINDENIKKIISKLKEIFETQNNEEQKIVVLPINNTILPQSEQTTQSQIKKIKDLIYSLSENTVRTEDEMIATKDIFQEINELWICFYECFREQNEKSRQPNKIAFQNSFLQNIKPTLFQLRTKIIELQKNFELTNHLNTFLKNMVPDFMVLITNLPNYFNSLN